MCAQHVVVLYVGACASLWLTCMPRKLWHSVHKTTVQIYQTPTDSDWDIPCVIMGVIMIGEYTAA